MREILAVWRSPRQTVLVGVIAAAYAAVLIPFKFIPVIPGYTELRPANAVPVAMAILFGPAAAWGSAFGNLIGDLFGTLSLGSLFGFVGNFLYGLIPFQVWRLLSRGRTPSWIAGYGFLAAGTVLASAACGGVIGWGIETLGIGPPFVYLGNFIVINNAVMSLVLAPLLLVLLIRPMTELGLTYDRLRGESEPRGPGARHVLGSVLLVVGCVGVMVACNLVGWRVPVEKYKQILPFVSLPTVAPGSPQAMGVAGAPFILLILIGCALL